MGPHPRKLVLGVVSLEVDSLIFVLSLLTDSMMGTAATAPIARQPLLSLACIPSDHGATISLRVTIGRRLSYCDCKFVVFGHTPHLTYTNNLYPPI